MMSFFFAALRVAAVSGLFLFAETAVTPVSHDPDGHFNGLVIVGRVKPRPKLWDVLQRPYERLAGGSLLPRRYVRLRDEQDDSHDYEQQLNDRADGVGGVH